MRLVMILLPLLALSACDRQSGDKGQDFPIGAETGKVDMSNKGQDMPAVPFLGPDGGPATLTGFRGKPLLVNLWATWCAPCIAEMPALDKLAVAEKDRLQVIVVSQDMAGKRAVDPYFAKAKFSMLQPYLDKENMLALALKTETLPITLLYDADGKEQWRVVGAMDWHGESARKLLDEALSDRS
ncbi:MAG: TlpA family protein disulfide reductase [Sphingomonadaceae bacterium]